MAASTGAVDAARRDLPDEYGELESAIDPATWKKIHLRSQARWDDGTLDEIHDETLQSPAWLAEHGIRAGSPVPMPLEFIGVDLPADLRADVLSIEPCPPIADGPGRVVQTVVSHLNADVYELTVEAADGRQEIIRPTGGHKMYQADQGRWISASELGVGDHLSGVDGPLKIVGIRKYPGVHRVYNLTVQGEHVYHVSSLGALTHNTLLCLGKGPNGAVDPKAVVNAYQGFGRRDFT